MSSTGTSSQLSSSSLSPRFFFLLRTSEPLTIHSPNTCSFAKGLVVPMPTFVPSLYKRELTTQFAPSYLKVFPVIPVGSTPPLPLTASPFQYKVPELLYKE